MVAQQRVLGDLGDRVQAQPVDAAVHPEAQHVVHRGHDLGVLPVEVGLLAHEAVQVVLARGLVEGPRGADGLEDRVPVVGRVAPDVPVALGVVAAGARLDEPRMLVGAVVRDPVEDDLDGARVALLDQLVEVVEGAEDRVDVAVVGDVVAEVGHRRGEDRRQPDRLDVQRLQVVEVRGDPREIPHPVAVGVGERAWIDLVDGAPLPPGRLRHGGIVT